MAPTRAHLAGLIAAVSLLVLVPPAAAQQASALVSLPLIMVAYSQATGSLYGGTALGWYIGAVAWVLAIIALWRGVRVVTRGRLLGVADEQ